MLFQPKVIHELLERGYTDIIASDDDQYWMACYREKYGLYSLRYGRYWNWEQFIFDVNCKRNKDLYFELSKMLLYIAEHSSKPLEKILPSHLADMEAEKFFKQALVTKTAIQIRMEKQVTSQKKKNGKRIHVAVAELVIDKNVPLPRNPEPDMPPPIELREMILSPDTITYIDTESSRPEDNRTSQEQQELKDDSKQISLYKAKEVDEESYLTLLTNIRPAKPARNEYAHISYDLLLEVEVKRDKTMRTMARTSLPKYTIELGRFFRMYPGDYNKDFRTVFVGHRGEGEDRQAFFLFDNELMKKQWPEDVRDLPIQTSGRKWSFEDRKLGEYILEALGKKPQSVLGSKKVYKINLEPMARPGAKPGEKLELKDVRDFVVAEVSEKFYANGVIPDEDRDIPSDGDGEVQV